jgi:hypothetical protein
MPPDVSGHHIRTCAECLDNGPTYHEHELTCSGTASPDVLPLAPVPPHLHGSGPDKQLHRGGSRRIMWYLSNVRTSRSARHSSRTRTA